MERGTASALSFYPLTPCRVVDTRTPTGGLQRNACRCRREQRVRTSGRRSGVCVLRHSGASRLAGLPDPVAGRTNATLSLDLECRRRSHHRQYGHRALRTLEHRALARANRSIQCCRMWADCAH